MNKKTVKIVLALAGLFMAMQLVPYGRDHANPPVIKEPAWDSPQTRALAKRACFDCHSNETRWPWYSHVAPVSWMLQQHVSEGRSHLNFSEWNRDQTHGPDAEKALREGEMPLKGYVLMHREAQLNPDEKGRLVTGLQKTFPKKDKSKGPSHDHDHHDHHHDHHH